MGISSILYSQSGDRTLQPIQTDWMVARTPDKRPVLTVFSMRNKKYTSTPQYRYATWVKDAYSTDVTAAYVAGTTTISVTDSSVWIVGDEIINETTGDVMGITNIPSGVAVDVYRLPGATTGSIGHILRKYSRSATEASDAPEIRMFDTDPESNNVQIFRHPYGESGTQARTDPGPGYSMEEQREVKWLEHIDDIEGAWFKGQGDYDTSSRTWRTKGLIPSIQTNVYALGGTLTLKLFRDWILDSPGLSKSGSQKKVILSNGQMDKAFSDWKIYVNAFFPTQIGMTDVLPPMSLDVGVVNIAGRQFYSINYEYMTDTIDESRVLIVDPADIGEMVTKRTGTNMTGDMVHRPVGRDDGYDGYDYEFFKEAGFYMKEEWRHGIITGITGINPDPTA